MAKEDETPRTNPAEIENLIEQIRKTSGFAMCGYVMESRRLPGIFAAHVS
jgi:hypothetical protein